MRYLPGWRHVMSALLLALVAAALEAASLPDLIERVRPSIVGVGTAYPPRQPLAGQPPNSLRGTGFVVGDGRTIVTNSHVLPEVLDSDNKQVLAVFSGRGGEARPHLASVLLQDATHDLALLRIESDQPLTPLTLGDSAVVREGQQVVFTGFPLGAVLGLYPVTHRGMVSAITPMAGPMDSSRQLTAVQLRHIRNLYEVFQLDATAYPGNSGSPVYLPDSGQVIGVVNSVFVKESREALLERPSGISYAIPASHVQALLRRADALQ
jgi:S1-C subfamily serine protease